MPTRDCDPFERFAFFTQGLLPELGEAAIAIPELMGDGLLDPPRYTGARHAERMLGTASERCCSGQTLEAASLARVVLRRCYDREMMSRTLTLAGLWIAGRCFQQAARPARRALLLGWGAVHADQPHVADLDVEWRSIFWDRDGLAYVAPDDPAVPSGLRPRDLCRLLKVGAGRNAAPGEA